MHLIIRIQDRLFLDSCYKSTSDSWINLLGTDSTPAAKAQFLKILSIAQVTKSRMTIRVECNADNAHPSLIYLVFDD